MKWHRLTNYLLGFLLFALVVQVVLILPRPVNLSHAENFVPPLQRVSSDIERTMDGAHLIGTQNGKQEWELWAEKAIGYKGTDAWELTTVKVIFFGDDGVQFVVTGKRGEVDLAAKNMRVEGDVLVKSTNGYVFTTRIISYDSLNRQFQAPEPVEMKGPKMDEGRMYVTGDMMETDLLSSMMIIRGQVRTTKAVSRGRTVGIRSQEVQVSGKGQTAKFLGSVVIDMEGMRITGPEAEFQYNKNSTEVESINVAGGVSVSDSSKMATSKSLKIHFDQDKYVFKGNPRVVQDGDVLRGEEIVFLDGGRKITVIRARAKVDEKSLEKVN